MNTSEAQQSIKNVTSELFSLNPSALISLFIIDVSDLLFNQGIASETELLLKRNVEFRFHNNINLTSKSIFWQGDEYVAAPIQADGFEMNIKGSTPTPRLGLTVSDEGIPTLSRLKDRIYQMAGDIIGAKVIRIRTFAKFLDEVNFIGGIPPQNFFPDPNSELPRDIYYIDRKSEENKNIISYELSPIFDVDGIKLPGRIVSANSCVAQYRSHGCNYEYSSRKSDIHGDATLPASAPPVATVHNEKITSLLSGVAFIDKGKYNLNQIYSKGDFIYIEHRDIKYYFVSKINNNSTQPPDSSVWMQDECSKKVLGCKLRFGNISDGSLPFVGFPSCTRFR